MDLGKNCSYTNISLALAFLYSPSLIILVIFDKTGINRSLGYLMILSNLLYLAHRYSNTTEFLKFQRKIIFIYLIIIIYIIIVWISLYDGQRNNSPKGIILTSLCLIAFFYILNSSNFNLPKLTNFIIVIAFIFSILSINLYIGYLLGYMPVSKYILPGYQIGTGMGFGGFLAERASFEQFLSLRNMSYWSEPAKFAQYLQLPIFLSIYKYSINKNLKNLFISVTIITAFLLTFSVANFFSVLIAYALYSVFLKVKISKFKIRYLLIGLILIFIIFKFYQLTNVEGKQYVFAKGTDSTLENRFERFSTVYNFINKTPFGDVSKSDATDNPTAIGNILVIGGFPLLIIDLIIMIIFFINYNKHIRRSRYKIIFIIFINFFIAFIWYGNFHGLYFLFLISLYSTYIRYEKLNKSII